MSIHQDVFLQISQVDIFSIYLYTLDFQGRFALFRDVIFLGRVLAGHLLQRFAGCFVAKIDNFWVVPRHHRLEATACPKGSCSRLRWFSDFDCFRKFDVGVCMPNIVSTQQGRGNGDGRSTRTFVKNRTIYIKK